MIYICCSEDKGRKTNEQQNPLNKMKHAGKILCVLQRKSSMDRENRAHVLSSSPSSEPPVCKTWWEACIYIGSTCYDVISPAPCLVFIIMPGPLWGSTKTSFIDSGEAYPCLMHCLYVGLQPHPSGNKQ